MADSIRKQIFQNLVAALEGVESLRNAGFGTYELLREDRPFASIIPIEENTDNEPDDIYIERLQVAARVVVDETHQDAGYELEDIMGDVHRAILTDPKRGALAEDTVKIGVKWLFLDREYPRAGADINFLITYSTEEKDPSDINFDSP